MIERRRRLRRSHFLCVLDDFGVKIGIAVCIIFSFLFYNYIAILKELVTDHSAFADGIFGIRRFDIDVLVCFRGHFLFVGYAKDAI